MLINIVILAGLAFSVFYPLLFWRSIRRPWEGDAYKFHLALPNTVGGVTVIALMLMPIPWGVKGVVLFWKAVLVGTSRYFWKKGNPDPKWMTVPCVTGIYALITVQHALVGNGNW